jgi:hypothetical protein
MEGGRFISGAVTRTFANATNSTFPSYMSVMGSSLLSNYPRLACSVSVGQSRKYYNS